MSYQIPLLSELPISKNDPRSYEGINYRSYNHTVETKSLIKICDKYSHIKEGDKILDFGCGTGRIIKNLQNKVDIVGIDICRRYYDICLNNKLNVDYVDLFHDEYNPDGKISIHDFKLPYQNKSFDKVLSFYVFNHLYDRYFTQSLVECLRVLKNNGMITMSCMIINDTREQILKVDGSCKYYQIGEWWFSNEHRQNLNVGVLEKLLRRIVMLNGGQIIEPIRYCNWSGASKYKPDDLLLIRKL